MKYTINIESAYRSNVFRLDNNNKWFRCDNIASINENDRVFINHIDVVSVLKTDLNLELEGAEYEIESGMGTELGNERQLHYEVYGFRHSYPNPPDENQLLNLLLGGDDMVRNVLVLKTDGLFYLLNAYQILDYPVNPDYVVQFEGFQPNNGYVGNSINDNNIRYYVQNLFRIGIFHWVNHLKYKILHDQADIEIRHNDQVPEILELFDELHQIQQNWQPDYHPHSVI